MTLRLACLLSFAFLPSAEVQHAQARQGAKKDCAHAGAPVYSTDLRALAISSRAVGMP